MLGERKRSAHMQYYRCRWLQDDPEFPHWIIAELDENRWETRKVEIFPDGAKGYASRDAEFGGTFLGLEPIPSLAEIALDPQFVVEAITSREFEDVWSARTVSNR
jgi:hypothetical protein